jgi:signal transduction histidine kinase
MNARCEGKALQDAAREAPGSQQLARSIGALTEMVKACVGADACLIAIERASPRHREVYGMAPAAGRVTTAHVAQILLDTPNETVILSGASPRRARASATALAAVAEILKAGSVICLPLGLTAAKARLCVARVQHRYTSRSAAKLASLARQVSVLLEAICFGERLAIELARQERRQISRDLHDSAIQPYIGLKLGLEALRRRLGKDHALGSDVDELIAIAAAGMGELREYVGVLSTSPGRKKAHCLLSAVRSEAKKFGTLYGIEATVVAPSDISVPPPMQHEIIQMVREGLANIRRHTTASHAAIHLHQADGKLTLEISNDNAGSRLQCRFSPRSIGERAAELGGRVQAERRGRRTVVAVELPL